MTIAALATLTLVVLHSMTGFNVAQGAFMTRSLLFRKSFCAKPALATSLREATEGDARLAWKHAATWPHEREHLPNHQNSVLLKSEKFERRRTAGQKHSLE